VLPVLLLACWSLGECVALLRWDLANNGLYEELRCNDLLQFERKPAGEDLNLTASYGYL
jgi:hypothetical protein